MALQSRTALSLLENKDIPLLELLTTKTDGEIDWGAYKLLTLKLNNRAYHIAGKV